MSFILTQVLRVESRGSYPFIGRGTYMAVWGPFKDPKNKNKNPLDSFFQTFL